MVIFVKNLYMYDTKRPGESQALLKSFLFLNYPFSNADT
jgi:hypothetical protein